MFALFLLSLIIMLTNFSVPYVMGVFYKITEEKQHVLSHITKSSGQSVFDYVTAGDTVKLSTGDVYVHKMDRGIDYLNLRHRTVSIEQAMISTCRSVERLVKSNSCGHTYENVWKFISDTAAPGTTGTVQSVINGTSTVTCLESNFSCANIGDFGRCLLKNTYVRGNLTSIGGTFKYTLRDSISSSTYCNTPDIITLS